MHRWLVIFFCFVFLSAPVQVLAKLYIVSQVSTFSYGGWQPIPEHEMRAAAVDIALSEVSNGGSLNPWVNVHVKVLFHE